MVEIRKIDENRRCFLGGCDPTQLIIYSNIPRNICLFQLFGWDEMDATSQLALKHVFLDSPLSSLNPNYISQSYIPIIYPIMSPLYLHCPLNQMICPLWSRIPGVRHNDLPSTSEALPLPEDARKSWSYLDKS